METLFQNLLIAAVPFLVLLTVVITVHELGHFWAARAFGIAVDRFSLGFGKALISRTDRSGVEWRISAIPLGGYVRFAGDSNDASLPDQAALDDLKQQIEAREGPEAVKRFYHFKPVWQRAIVAAAGPFANFVLAIVILTGLLWGFGDTYHPPKVGQVVPGSAAEAAGFLPGDLILKANDRPVEDFNELTRVVMLRSGTPIPFEVRRGAETVTLVATPRREVIKNEVTGTESRMGRLGLYSVNDRSQMVTIRYNPATAFVAAVIEVRDTVGTTLTYLGRIVTGRESGKELSSVIGMGHAAGSVVKAAAKVSPDPGLAVANILLNLVHFTAVISVGIGFVNLLPIPMLDGGHLLFYGYEAIARKPVGAGVQEAGYKVGLALVLGLMLFATFNDLERLQAFRFLGGLFS